MRRQDREHDEIRPYSEFEIVPGPGRGLDEEKDDEDHAGCEKERDFFWNAFFPTESAIHDSNGGPREQDQH